MFDYFEAIENLRRSDQRTARLADESLNAGLDALIADINQSVKRGQQLGGIMDALFNGRQASPARAASCPACGRVKPDRCSLCSDYKREEQYYRTYDPNPSGE